MAIELASLPSDFAARVDRVVATARRGALTVDQDRIFPESAFATLRSEGMMGFLVPSEFGGWGGTVSEMVRVVAKIGEACTTTAFLWAMHCQQVDSIVRFGGSALRRRVLPDIAKGRVYVASVTTEAATGSDLLRSMSSVTANPTGLTMDRQAPVVSGGSFAEAFLVTLRADESAAPNQISLYYVERGSLEIQTGRTWNTMGLRGTASDALRLIGPVLEESLVGPRGDYRTVAMESHIPIGHLGWAACWLGAARGALEGTVKLIRSGAIPANRSSGEVFRDRLGRCRLLFEMNWSYLMSVANQVDVERGTGGSLASRVHQSQFNVLKVSSSEAALSIVDQLMSAVGLDLGYRVDVEVPLERIYRDLRSAPLNFSNDKLLQFLAADTIRTRSLPEQCINRVDVSRSIVHIELGGDAISEEV